MQQKRKRGWLVWLLIVAGILVLALLVATLGRNYLNKDTYSPKGPYIGVLFVEGSITSSNIDSGDPFWLPTPIYLAKIDSLIDDSDNKGLILYVDSRRRHLRERRIYLKLVEYKELTDVPFTLYGVHGCFWRILRFCSAIKSLQPQLLDWFDRRDHRHDR